MARTIYQRIALEGGKGIADELRKIGKEGEAAFVDIRSAAAKLSKDLGGVGRAFGDLGGSLLRVGRNLGIAGAAIGGAAAGVTAFVADASDAAKEIENLARVANSTPEVFQRWAAGAASVGIEQDKLADILKDTQDKIGDFIVTGGGPLADFFENIAPRVGVTAKEFNNLSGPQALQLYVKSLQRANLSQAQMTFYMEALASDSTLLLPLLRDNGIEMERFGEAAAKTGAVLEQQAIDSLRSADKSLTALGRAINGARLQIAALLAPSVTAGADALTQYIAENQQALRDWVQEITRFILPTVKDLINAVVGNDIDVQNVWVLKAKLEFLRFAYAVENAVRDIIVPAYQLIISAAQQVAEAINAAFGTNFTGQQILVAAAIAKIAGIFGLLASAINVVVATFVALKTAFGFIIAISKAGIFTVIVGAVKGLAAALVAVVGLPALIAAAFVAAGFLIFRFWDEIKAAAGATWSFIRTTFAGLPALFSNLFANVGAFIAEQFNAAANIIGGVWSIIQQGGQFAIDGIKAAFAGLGEFLNTVFITAANAVSEALNGISTAAQQIWEGISSGAVAAFNGLAEAASDVWTNIVQIAQTALSGLVTIFSNLVANLNLVWEAISRGASSVFSFMRDGFSGVVDFIGGLFDGLANRIERVWARIKSIVDRAKAALRSLNTTTSDEYSNSTEGFASGGYVRGPGSGTSDSIMARLSNGEFVIRAAAVRKYGPALLSALNNMRLPKVPGFNMGGLVSSLTTGMQYQMPRFADGGMVAIPAQAQGRPISLTIDGRTFDGLTASEKTAEDLSRFATNRRLKSAGRKPGWVG